MGVDFSMCNSRDRDILTFCEGNTLGSPPSSGPFINILYNVIIIINHQYILYSLIVYVIIIGSVKLKLLRTYVD